MRAVREPISLRVRRQQDEVVIVRGVRRLNRCWVQGPMLRLVGEARVPVRRPEYIFGPEYSLNGRINNLFRFCISLELTLPSAMLEVRAAPVGQIDLPAGEALHTPPDGRPICAVGAAGTPESSKPRSMAIKVRNDLDKSLVRPFCYILGTRCIRDPGCSVRPLQTFWDRLGSHCCRRQML